MNKAIQGNLLKIAGGFLLLQSIITTLSPVVRERTWDVDLPWRHWVMLAIWGIFVLKIHQDLKKKLPDSDPHIFPVAALLSGWGILTVWRIYNSFGERQMAWFVISMIVVIAGMRLTSLKFLQRYKYMLLIGGLSLTALTLIFGTNPSGYGPRLWLGWRGIYLQPSEPLKLLLIIYLSAYLADTLPFRFRTIHLLYPTLVLGGIVIMLLLAQRDLGTASIFLALYTIIIYLGTNRKRILLISVLSLILIGVAGYYFVGRVQARIDSWLNPWNDPSGSSYQVIQSLIATANGGIEGRGPGLGNPELVPVVISDFIYSAIAEETGLFGTLGLLALFGILITRTMRVAIRAPDVFRRLLAAGISTYFGVQTILIVGGNLRLLPLTGVTLPFVSYGGSSLLTSFIAILIILVISNQQEDEPAPLEDHSPYLSLNTYLLFGLFASALATGWWAILRGPDLLLRQDNLRRVIEEKYVPRGNILDRSNSPISVTTGTTGIFAHEYTYPDLAPITGYNSPNHGQAGLESSLDGYLRGLEGNPTSTILSNQLLYGMSPDGLDIRLSIAIALQSRVDELMRGQIGAVVLINARSGEILAMSSHPTFDPNRLNDISEELLSDPQKPLINRATLGLYPTGLVMEPFARALFQSTNLSPTQWQTLYETFGFNRTPELRMDVAPPTLTNGVDALHISPLQMALSASALSNGGVVPAARIVAAVNTPREGWVVLPALEKPLEAIQPSAADEAVKSFVKTGNNYWSHTAMARDDESAVAWFIGGTPPNWQASPLAIVVVLEEGDPTDAQRIGEALLKGAMNP